jgi:hypothetical protein
MTGSRRRTPSVGFVAVCLIYGLLAAFLLWGLSTPDLDRVWKLDLKLRTGNLTALDDGDRRLLERALTRYPGLAPALLEGEDIDILSEQDRGWIGTPTAVLLRSADPAAHRSILMDIQTPADFMPFSVLFRGRNWDKALEVEKRGPVEISVPEASGTPEIVTVELKRPEGGRQFSPDPSVLGVRITFPSADAAE